MEKPLDYLTVLSVNEVSSHDGFIQLFNKLVLQIKEIHLNSKSFLLILDDTLILEYSGVPYQTIALCITQLSELLKEKDTVVVSHPSLNQHTELSDFLFLICDTHINMQPLKTGATSEIHGQIYISEKPHNAPKKHLHYTLQETNITLFAPGFAKSIL